MASIEKALSGVNYGFPANSMHSEGHRMELSESCTGKITGKYLSRLRDLGFIVRRDKTYGCLHTAEKVIGKVKIRIELWDRDRYRKQFEENFQY